MIQPEFYLPQISFSRKIPVELAQVPLEYHQEPSGQCKHLLEFHANFAAWLWLIPRILLILLTVVCQKMPYNLWFSTPAICCWYLCQLHSFNCSAPLLLHMPFQFKMIHLLLSIILFFLLMNTHLVLITFSRNDRMSEILMNFPFSIPQFSHCLICIADSFWMLNHIPLNFLPHIFIPSQNYSYSLLNDIQHGNKNMEMYVAIIIGFRWPVLLQVASTGLKGWQEIFYSFTIYLSVLPAPVTAVFPFLFLKIFSIFPFPVWWYFPVFSNVGLFQPPQLLFL